MVKVTRLPIAVLRRNSLDAQAYGWSGVPLRLPRRGAEMPTSESSFSGGGPLEASGPMMRRVSPESTAFTMPWKVAIVYGYVGGRSATNTRSLQLEAAGAAGREQLSRRRARRGATISASG
eukprot:115287-Pleurochrysis_carterae.AAC.4